MFKNYIIHTEIYVRKIKLIFSGTLGRKMVKLINYLFDNVIVVIFSRIWKR